MGGFGLHFFGGKKFIFWPHNREAFTTAGVFELPVRGSSGTAVMGPATKFRFSIVGRFVTTLTQYCIKERHVFKHIFILLRGR